MHQIISFLDKEGKDKDKDKNTALAVPRLSVCADAQKVDRAKLAQTEVIITNFVIQNYSLQYFNNVCMLLNFTYTIKIVQITFYVLFFFNVHR